MEREVQPRIELLRHQLSAPGRRLLVLLQGTYFSDGNVSTSFAIVYLLNPSWRGATDRSHLRHFSYYAVRLLPSPAPTNQKIYLSTWCANTL